MSWIIAKKIDHSIVDVTSKPYEEDFTLSELEDVIPTNKGGISSDYSYFRMSKEEGIKYQDGQSYSIIWTGDYITGISFTAEESKPWIKLHTDKTYILGDGIDTATITLEFWKPDLSSIYDVVNFPSRRVSIMTPKGIRFVRLDIVNGVAHARFKCTETGTYTFPSDIKRYGASRIFNQITIEVDDVSLLELF